MSEPETTNQELDKAVEHIPTRAERRRFKREIMKQLNPPKYGPVVIYTRAYKREGGVLKKDYMMRTNIQNLEEFDRIHAKRDLETKGKVY